MKATKNMKSKFQSCVILSLAMSLGLQGISEGGETCPTNSSGPDICVSFSGDTPEENIDFTVDYTTDAANPSLTLLVANLTWGVHSDDSGSPGNIGTISIDYSGADDFSIGIKNGQSAGAANVGTINLNDAGFSGYSSLDGGRITGNLTGGLTLVQDSGGNGGKLTLTIDGDVSGAMTIPVLNGLSIGGDLSVKIDVTDEINGAGFTLTGSVTTTGELEVADIASGDITFETAAESFAGTLDLERGIPSGVDVTLYTSLTSTGVIDLNAGAVAGTLVIVNGGSGSIDNGGAVSGTVTLADGSTKNFTGDAAFASVSAGGVIKTLNSADLGGDVTITNDVAGDISVSDDLTSTGSVVVTGALANAGFAGGGRILVNGESNGLIKVGEKTGSLTLIHVVDGLGSGATVEINTTRGAFDAEGDILIGHPTVITAILFAGCIRIYDDGADDYGDLKGSLDVNGCHDDGAELVICIDGSDGGNVTLDQTGCSPANATWDCFSPGCP